MLTGQQSEGSFEASSTWRLVFSQTKVPFAGHEGEVAGILKNFGHSHDSLVEVAFVSKLPSGRSL